METEIKKGLVGVVVDTTKISRALAEEKKLYYRGYLVDDLADNCSFLEVAYLILHGELPKKDQLEKFSNRKKRALPKKLIELLKLLPKKTHPMDALRTAVSFLGTLESQNSKDEAANSLLLKIPSIIAHFNRLQEGEDIILPDDSLGFSENFFKMFFGSVPSEKIVRAFNACLILYAEHTFNASTFTARTVVSSRSDMYSGITAAIGSLKGPLHGGANEAVMHMLNEVGDVSNIEAWLKEALDNKKLIMGFGHRLYKWGDSRVPAMKKYRDLVAKETNREDLVSLSNAFEEAVKKEKGILPNLDFPAGPTFYMMNFPIPVFTPLFVMARISGWSAHVIEQLEDNRLVRPKSFYNGVEEREFIKIEDR